MIVRTLSEILQLSFKRIQFTPDLMPADIIGSEILQERERRLEFEYQPGPIFANLILADEINRTPPNTQAALLEAMQENKVTVAGQSRTLPGPFLVVATQTPSSRRALIPCPKPKTCWATNLPPATAAPSRASPAALAKAPANPPPAAEAKLANPTCGKA